MINARRPNIPVDYVLFKLNEIFSVKDISSTLETATDQTDAERKSLKLNFDRIPIDVNGAINEYFDSNDKKLHNITCDMFMSADAGLLETFSHLTKREFYLILEGTSITRFVHYSDLNSPLIMLGAYSQVSFCEEEMRRFFRFESARKANMNPASESDNENFLISINTSLTGNRVNIGRAKGQYDRKKLANVQTDIFDELYFDDELLIARALSLTSVIQSDADVGKYKDLRNDIMHSTPEFILNQSDVSTWLTFLQECQYIIRRIQFEMTKSNP